MSGEPLMPNLAKTNISILFSKLIATNATGPDAEVFGANTTPILNAMIASVHDVVGPSVFIEIKSLTESVLEIPDLPI